MIYDAEAHEALTDTQWDEARAREAIAAIVAEAESALDGALWPAHDLDAEPDDPGPWTMLYLGSAGMVWALHALGSELELADIAGAALRRYRERPDEGEAIPGLYLGESGLHVAAQVVGSEEASVERVRELVVANERNPTWELFWGSPGTMLAARELGLTAEYERSAELLVEQWDGLWTQVIQGREHQFLGPAHGFAGNVHALRGFLPDDELRARIEPALREHAVTDGGLVNWPPVVGHEPTRVQWCHGAPGIVTTVGDLLPEDLLLGGAELTWRAGPLAKGPGLCHGTAGNGYALLRAHALTGDDEWLARARRFAMHALEQAEREPRRFSLFTGNVGAALFARACVEADARFPTIDVW